MDGMRIGWRRRVRSSPRRGFAGMFAEAPDISRVVVEYSLSIAPVLLPDVIVLHEQEP